MCTSKKTVKLKPNQDKSKLWKMPHQLSSVFIKNQQPYMMTKCGKCYECKKEKARAWTYKIWLESLSHDKKCFLTLTYRDNEKGKNLNKKDLQDFIKKLRKNEKLKSLKYFAAGEYGEKKGRAHYHLILLGYLPNDLRKDRRYKSKKGHDIYISNKLNNLWGHGILTVQLFGKDEIGYLTLYLDNNSVINNKVNFIQLKKRKEALNELQVKHGIKVKHYYKSVGTKYENIRYLKDLSKEELKAYKQEYLKTIKPISMLKTNEFNLSSKNMGFDNYIKYEYYKYDLNLENYTFERPKEYLRKIMENQHKYNDEIIGYTAQELMKRKKYAEDNYIDPADRLKTSIEKSKELWQKDQDKDRKKLYTKHESSF